MKRRDFIALAGTAAAAGSLPSDAYAQGNNAMTPQAMIDLFQKHVNAELAGDLDTTMATMNDNPHLNHVPTMAGGVGRDGVRTFYRDHLVGKFFPPDVKMTTISRTVGESQIAEEVSISFTHTTAIDWLMPGVAPTGKRVEMAVVVIVGFKDGKISHEHIYWDQAGVLVQAGLLDPRALPVTGAESARKVVDPSLPPRRMCGPRLRVAGAVAKASQADSLCAKHSKCPIKQEFDRSTGTGKGRSRPSSTGSKGRSRRLRRAQKGVHARLRRAQKGVHARLRRAMGRVLPCAGTRLH